MGEHRERLQEVPPTPPATLARLPLEVLLLTAGRVATILPLVCRRALVVAPVISPPTRTRAGTALRAGFIVRTPRGRVATAAGFQHMGLVAPSKAPTGGQGGSSPQGRLF